MGSNGVGNEGRENQGKKMLRRLKKSAELRQAPTKYDQALYEAESQEIANKALPHVMGGATHMVPHFLLRRIHFSFML